MESDGKPRCHDVQSVGGEDRTVERTRYFSTEQLPLDFMENEADREKLQREGQSWTYG